MADVNNWFEGDDDGVNSWGDGFDPGESPAPPGEGVLFFGPLPATVAPDEPVEITVHVVDSVGNPVSGVAVTLTVSGVAYTGDTSGSTVAGAITFTITPTEDGTMLLEAASGDLEAAASVAVSSIDPTAIAIGRAKKAKRERAAREARWRIERRPSYLDVPAIAASPPPAAAGYTPEFGFQPTPVSPGMDRLAQHLGALLADQERKLMAEIEAFRKNLT